MFKRILVPLDGSALSESAVPIAARIARATDGTVVLVRVTPVPMEYGPYLYQPYASPAPVFAQEILDAEQEKAEYYLRDIAHRECLEGLNIEVKAPSGMAAATILEKSQLMSVDLIVMYSHGRSGFTRWALGSVAEKIARHSSLPVLLLRDDDPVISHVLARINNPMRALVVLDGSPFSEATVLPAAQLITALADPGHAALHLAHIVKWRPSGGEGDFVSTIDVERAMQEATNYLARVAENVRKSLVTEPALQVTWSVVAKEDVADGIIQMAEIGEGIGIADAQPCSLIAMSTHRWGGLHRRVMGSITGRVVDGTRLPLLILHPQQPDDEEYFGREAATRKSMRC
ncbi:MAG TPA: universal stress protein [Ktedonobacteraceae bacterium]|nr:universal stress protein [Ktedonobacteraceae bacterium]